jgi:hypothetical protein
MNKQRNNFGELALLLPLYFKFVNANCICSLTNNIKYAGQTRTYIIKFDPDRPNGSRVRNDTTYKFLSFNNPKNRNTSKNVYWAEKKCL